MFTGWNEWQIHSFSIGLSETEILILKKESSIFEQQTTSCILKNKVISIGITFFQILMGQ